MYHIIFANRCIISIVYYYKNLSKCDSIFVWFPISVKLNILLATVTNTLESHMCWFRSVLCIVYTNENTWQKRSTRHKDFISLRIPKYEELNNESIVSNINTNTCMLVIWHVINFLTIH